MQSIKFRLIGLAICLALVGIGLRLASTLPFAQGHLRALVSTQQLSSANYVARDIGQSIHAQRRLINELAKVLSPQLADQPQELETWLKDRHLVSPLFNNGLIVVRADSGKLAAQYPPKAQHDRSYAESDWYREALQSTDLVVSKPYRATSGEPILVMAKAVRDNQERVVAVLAGVVALNAPGFLDGVQNESPDATFRLLLISPADKLFIAASNPEMVFKPTPALGTNLLHDRAMTGYRGTGITTNAQGVEELSAIVSVPDTEWFLVTTIPTSEAFKPISSMRGFFVAGSLIVVSVMIAVLLWALPHILAPLTLAARSMRDMADGKQELAAIPIKRKDEVGDLVLGFNYLVARLREKDDALKASQARMQFLAHHDSLTGLLNRSVMEDRLQQALARSERDGTHFALLFCDLDGFKSINDEHGHETGDVILRHVAVCLQKGRRRTDTVARLGGDEFIVLLTDIKEAEETSTSVAAALQDAIGTPIEIGGNVFSVSISIGIALHRGITISASQLMSRADSAMYQVKRSGKNGIRIFDEAKESAVQDS